MKESAKLPVTQTNTSETVIASQPIFTRILAITDFSLRSQAAVEYAVQLAKSMHARTPRPPVVFLHEPTIGLIRSLAMPPSSNIYLAPAKQ